MKRLRIIDFESGEFREFLKTLSIRASGGGPEVETSVRTIIDEVAREGDRAVRRYTAKFDGVSPRSLKVSRKVINKAWKSARKDVVRSLKTCADRIYSFHEHQKERSWFHHEGGALLGQLVRPLGRVGVYVPGGKASYPSSVLMNVIPAQVAGVEDITMCVPMPGGEINPYVLVAADMLGVNRVFAIGGAQAVAAMAYGTRTVPRVDKIVGPGNIYVATAKRMVFGSVDIDMIAGPSEILVIADDSADPSFVAADMLGQAEHDEMASAVLVTPSRDLAGRVGRELAKQMKQMARRALAESAINSYGAAVITADLREAVKVSNSIAPEHLEVMTEKPMELVPNIRNAGAVFLGHWTPEALGDYAAGPNHTLPTGGTARFFSPLGVYDFLKKSSLLSFPREEFLKLAGPVELMAGVEGLEGHAGSVRLRRRIKAG